MMTDLLKNRRFQFWEYSVSLGSLLIRSPKGLDQEFNIDIMFFGVEYVTLPRFINQVFVSSAKKDELQSLERILDKKVNKKNVFVLEGTTSRYLVVAVQMKILKNELDLSASPFDELCRPRCR